MSKPKKCLELESNNMEDTTKQKGLALSARILKEINSDKLKAEMIDGLAWHPAWTQMKQARNIAKFLAKPILWEVEL